ncbi:MAG: tetratricopeptide repeat protein [Candidatus Cloacimonetes bacterium]|nr:tetratricopeptide repeat protein [Candidatus Cloacimonadota bacterium]
MDEAIARYEGLIRNNPNNAQAYLNVVSLYRQQASEASDPAIVEQLNTKAINAMNELKRVDPENPMAYLNLASIYLAQGKNADAETNANLTLQKDPTLYQPYIILATVNQSKGTNDYNVLSIWKNALLLLWVVMPPDFPVNVMLPSLLPMPASAEQWNS